MHNNQTPPASPSFDTIAQLRQQIAHLFWVADTTLDFPEPGYFRFRGRPQGELEPHYDELRQHFEQYGYTPLAQPENGQVVLLGLPLVITPPPLRWRWNLVLFLLTILSTLFTGAVNEPAFGEVFTQAIETGTGWGAVVANLWRGLPFCLSIMLILGAHEMGHFFAARYHKVAASLPYFLPLPYPLSYFGTLGAFILQRSPSKNARVQFDIGASGPLAGLVFAIPLLIYGLATSPVGPLPEMYMREGNSILYVVLKFLVFGEVLPSGGMDVSLNQVAWAGWTGLLITGINLLPVGQLDGGRVAQVLFGQRVLKQMFWPIIAGLAIFSLIAQSPIWVVMIFLLLSMGRQYEQPLDSVTQLDPRRRALAIFTLILFVLIFVPVPLEWVGF
ncbi:MAG: site-2 protease family protein [Chloroflexi bacterium]|nr:site-2 protease family protein [Chloroflexota bacterium]